MVNRKELTLRWSTFIMLLPEFQMNLSDFDPVRLLLLIRFRSKLIDAMLLNLRNESRSRQTQNFSGMRPVSSTCSESLRNN